MSEQDLRASLTALAHTQRGEHLSPEILLSYHLGELQTELEEPLQDHLARCPECTRALLDFQSFPEVRPAPETTPTTGDDVEELWRGVRSKLPRKRRFFASVQFARVAALLFLTTTLAFGSALLRQAPTSPPAPGLNLPIFELRPTDSRSTRMGDPEDVHPLGTDADGAFIILVLAEAEPAAKYQVVLESAQGEEVWSTRALERTPEGLLSLYLARDFLPAGHYTLHLSGLGDDTQKPLARFELHLEYR